MMKFEIISGKSLLHPHACLLVDESAKEGAIRNLLLACLPEYVSNVKKMLTFCFL